MGHNAFLDFLEPFTFHCVFNFVNFPELSSGAELRSLLYKVFFELLQFNILFYIVFFHKLYQSFIKMNFN